MWGLLKLASSHVRGEVVDVRVVAWADVGGVLWLGLSVMYHRTSAGAALSDWLHLLY